MGEFPSGQRGQTVNLLSVTSMVRIHLPPIKSTYFGRCFFVALKAFKASEAFWNASTAFEDFALSKLQKAPIAQQIRGRKSRSSLAFSPFITPKIQEQPLCCSCFVFFSVFAALSALFGILRLHQLFCLLTSYFKTEIASVIVFSSAS